MAGETTDRDGASTTARPDSTQREQASDPNTNTNAAPSAGAANPSSSSETPTPASPPLPQKHIPATPGPRAQRLQKIYADALSHTLAKLSWENVAACYPTVAARAPTTLRAVQRQMVDLLREKCNREFESVLQNRNVVAKLNELENLVGEAGRRREENPEQDPPAAPHLLPAEDVLAAHLAPHLASAQSQLNAKLQTIQSHNVSLFDEIQDQRAEAEALLGVVERVLADMDGATGLLDGLADELTKEARSAEVEMSGM